MPRHGQPRVQAAQTTPPRTPSSKTVRRRPPAPLACHVTTQHEARYDEGDDNEVEGSGGDDDEEGEREEAEDKNDGHGHEDEDAEDPPPPAPLHDAVGHPPYP